MWTGWVVHCWTGRVVHGGPDVWSGILSSGDVVLRAPFLLKWRPVPAVEIACRPFTEVWRLCQPPARSSAPAFHAKVARCDHDDEAVVLQLAEPSPHIIAVAVRAEFFNCGAGRQIDPALQQCVIPATKRNVERPGAMRQRAPCWGVDCAFDHRYEVGESALVARFHAAASLALALA